MIGSIIGDIIGSTYEFSRQKIKNFELFPRGTFFTDDSVLCFAVADAILTNSDYKEKIQKYAKNYPDRGYGCMFRNWITNPTPYGSFGNGAAMRVSPVGFAFDSIEETLKQAKLSTIVSHNHTEGIKGAQATASAIFLARKKHSKKAIKEYIESTFKYDLTRKLDDIRPNYCFDETCQNTVPEAIISFLESNDYEDAIRNAISLGGDADTLACITGGIAQAFYQDIPEKIKTQALSYIDKELIVILEKFNEQFM